MKSNLSIKALENFVASLEFMIRMDDKSGFQAFKEFDCWGIGEAKNIEGVFMTKLHELDGDLTFLMILPPECKMSLKWHDFDLSFIVLSGEVKNLKTGAVYSSDVEYGSKGFIKRYNKHILSNPSNIEAVKLVATLKQNHLIN